MFRAALLLAMIALASSRPVEQQQDSLTAETLELTAEWALVGSSGGGASYRRSLGAHAAAGKGLFH